MPETIRQDFIQRLNEDLVGPHEFSEILRNRPSDIYLTGILWPNRTHISLAEDDGIEADDSENDIAPGLSIAGQQRPSAMGVSFAVASMESTPEIEISYAFATYKSSVEKDSSGKTRLWSRIDHQGKIKVTLNPKMNEYLPLALEQIDSSIDVVIHVRTLNSKNATIATATLINRTVLSDEDSIATEEMTLFQTHMYITCIEPTNFLGLPSLRSPLDDDEKSTSLLYRNSVNFAFGHQCSAEWDRSGLPPKYLETKWIPAAKVPNYKQIGHEVFSELVESGALSAYKLATCSEEELIRILKKLGASYEEWIDFTSLKIEDLSKDLEAIAAQHMEQCQEVASRIMSGIKFLESDPNAMTAFRFANMAMNLQHSWKKSEGDINSELIWRPFQLGFVLLTLESICDGKSEYRNTLDLLWFPTGGGKTEAYLALIAMGSWYRRLTKPTNISDGNFAVMRYTLRLLTSQQFERASAVILACEIIRKGFLKDFNSKYFDIPVFSIGLWVGQDATPNNFDSATTNRGNDHLASPEQISFCYSCHSKLHWNYDSVARSVRPSCPNLSCLLGKSFGIWPVITVDDDIYASRPTVLIGTVDKFAQLPLKLETSNIFGFGQPSGTELIIQDELHLISGPLGTIVGIYEAAIDWLLTRGGVRPKIIGSTATIRRASAQVRALFDRESCQFPPAGIDFDDSGFAVIDENHPGRTYLGITTAGRSAKFVLQGAAGSLLQSGSPSRYEDGTELDGYMTLLMYFNALRELGGAIVQVLDDVPDSMSLFSSIRKEELRVIDAPKELTSRVSQREIVSILADLSQPYSTEGFVDVVLATNMVSVGVDVPRLGLMLVNGQPKTRAEYIQSTSRVGRSNYPGLVICLYNAMKARDRSHFETFASVHQALYRDVEATSVTPFASRSRDRALRAILITMIRHSDPSQRNRPDFSNLNMENLRQIIAEIERRVANIDPSVLSQVSSEIDDALNEWSLREIRSYLDNSVKGIRTSLLQYAEDYARRIASGNFGGNAWPVMNTMRSVEASTPFRLKEKIFKNFGLLKNNQSDSQDNGQTFPWRRPDGS